MTDARWTRVGLGLGLLGLGVLAARLALHKAFSIDEFQYAHAAWLVSKGQVPYRDFFEVHFPLVYQALAPLFWLLGDSPRGVLALRAAMLVPLLGSCVAVAALNRREGRGVRWLGPVLLLSLVPFTRFATELRPDALSTALFLGALAALSVRPGTRWSGFVAGLAYVAALWASQKGCVLRVDDLRTSGLPPGLRGFLDTHYQPYDGDLFLWGQRYDVKNGDRLEDRFLAVRQGRYFVEPASVLETGALFIDGQRVTQAELVLERGEHPVRYEGPAERFHLLWLPRDGRRWTPRPDARPTYSRLF
ncbi:hypothetical protein [Myxococcus sp. AB025B]|uniref:hypothetical protein n=1 Tax=Myxococcus sp. AB025B TaxID=2562794 RepID=UPI001145096F|nr:hypothetical protein [Myxococcus sp. AB025B]